MIGAGFPGSMEQGRSCEIYLVPVFGRVLWAVDDSYLSLVERDILSTGTPSFGGLAVEKSMALVRTLWVVWRHRESLLKHDTL